MPADSVDAVIPDAPVSSTVPGTASVKAADEIDSDTLDAARAGCAEAFGDLVRATYDNTYSLAFRLTGNHHDAHDVAQDTYLRAFRAVGRFRGDSHFATWLYRITANCAQNVLRRRARHNGVELLADAPIVDPKPVNDPVMVSEAHELRASVRAALLALPAKLRDVVVLRDVYGLGHEAIAEALGISETAAKVRLHRARRKLAETLFPADPVSETPAAPAHAPVAASGAQPGADAGARGAVA